MSIFLTKQKIKKEWTDYNGHMNVAYYVLIFDQYGSEELMTLFKMGEESAKTTKKKYHGRRIEYYIQSRSSRG